MRLCASSRGDITPSIGDAYPPGRSRREKDTHMSFGLTVPGRLGADPETRHTPSGQVVTEFRVAVSGYDTASREKTTTWVRCTMWGPRGEQLGKLLHKGDAACFMGVGALRTYTNRQGVEVTALECTASDCALLGSSGGGGGGARPASAPRAVESDDLPF